MNNTLILSHKTIQNNYFSFKKKMFVDSYFNFVDAKK